MHLPVIPKSALDIRPITNPYSPRFMNPGELEVLIALVRMVMPKTMVEIGVNNGRTAKLILEHVGSIERYIGIDVMPGYVTSKTVQRREVPLDAGQLVRGDPRFELLLSAKGSLDLDPYELPACDVVFIDGDHGEVAVRHDTFIAHSVIQYGGMIIWHDYHELGTVDVKQELDRMYTQSGLDLQHVEGTWLVFERFLRPK